MNAKQRAALIRRGNELFNEKNYTEAEKIFVKTGYKDGLVRIGDYLYYEKRQPLAAYKYYRMTGSRNKINEIFERMIFAFKNILAGKTKDDLKDDIHLEPIDIHPKLKLAAMEILRQNEESDNNSTN
jgi:hypothetical protein